MELLRRRLAERGLLSEDQQPADSDLDAGLSDGQRRMWFVQILEASTETSGALLNVCVSYRLTGPVDAARLHTAVDAVARRHPILRTTYYADENGEPQARLHDDLRPAWAEHDLSGLSEHARKLRLEVLAQREFAVPFDLTTDAPLRITLVRTAADEHILLLVAHHIAWDDGSWRVFFDDLTRAYAGDELAPLPNRRSAQVADTTEADLAHWRQVLADPPEPLELPGPNGSVVPTSFRSQRNTLRLDADTARRVAELARDTGATPYMVVLTAFAALIRRYTHADDFLAASPVLNRGQDAEDLIGYYGNTVVLRLQPKAGQSFRELLAQTRDTALGAFAHQRVNLDRVVAELNPDRRHGTERMARVSFGFREADSAGFTPPGVQCARAELRGQHTQLPLGFMVELDETGVMVEAEYLVEVLDQALARQLLDHFGVLLKSALQEPDRSLATLELMGAEDAEWLRGVSTGERFDTPATTLTDLVGAQVARTPDGVAVVYEGRKYTYREINESANQLAHWLISQGIGTEDRVAVLLDKSPELVITALAVVKAGAVYLPIDPTYPEDRLNFILGDSDPKLVLREPVTDVQEQPRHDPTDADRLRPLRPNNTAYLIYTSGSTGLPKGVSVPHRPVAEYFVWFGDEYQVNSSERLLQVASPSFDVSIGEIFGMLACGARLVIPRPDGLRDIGYLTELLHDEGITSMHFVPSLLGLFLSLPGVNQWRTLHRVPIGGEALPGEIADKFHATFDAWLHNFYGPTETVINASRYKVEGKQGTRIVPIGKPKINTDIHLLDDALQPVPVGVIGEIYIGGTHVAPGYHHRPGLTAERFVADPFTPGGRLYRSGDLARRNADGDIEFVGRADEQVKIRGFRIELGDVAAAISVDPSVGQAVVVVSDLPQLGKSLVGYLTPAADAEDVDVERVRARVAAALPEYMVPAGYVVLGEIPITAHGKIDRNALPEPEIRSATEFREPTTPTEHTVAGLFAELLGRDRIGADDSFFDLGGHSLLATKLVAAVRSGCGVDIGVREVFELGTVAALAAHIDELSSGAGGPLRPPLVATDHDGPAPMSASQLRTWFQYRVDGPNPVNNVPFAARLAGPCDVDALIAAVQDVVARHESLRTTYREIDGVPHQIVHDPAPVQVRRARGDGEEWLQNELDRERHYVFDLEQDWPVRAAVLSTPDEHVLSLLVHHIAADHWSAGVLFTDVVTAYLARHAGGSPELSPLPVQYADYAAWQAQLLSDDTGLVAAQREYWTQQLAGLPQHTGLRPDFARPPVPSGAGQSIEFTIDPDVRRALDALTRETGTTDFMLLQAAVALVLYKAGEGTDIPLGTPVAGRTESELDQLIGFFINILVLRNDLSGNPTLREVLERVRAMALSAYAHQDLPFDQVVDAVSPVRSLSRNPLFDVVVHVREELPSGHVIDSGPGGDTTFTALEPTFDVAHADLSLNFFLTEDNARGHVIYRPELYKPATVRRFIRWLQRVVQAFADNPDLRLHDLDIADAEDRVVEQWGAGALYLLDETLRPVPVGVVGDVYHAGGPLLRAQYGRPAVTAVQLVANPLAGEPGSRLYRSGERARWTDEGVLEFVGSVARPTGPTAPAQPDEPSGPAEPPRTDTEKALARLLIDVLELGDDTELLRDDDFFELGGDSILAVQLAARARDIGLPLTARMVFEHTELDELAAALDRGGSATVDDSHHEPMSASGLSADELAAVASAWTETQTETQSGAQ